MRWLHILLLHTFLLYISFLYILTFLPSIELQIPTQSQLSSSCSYSSSSHIHTSSLSFIQSLLTHSHSFVLSNSFSHSAHRHPSDSSAAPTQFYRAFYLHTVTSAASAFCSVHHCLSSFHSALCSCSAIQSQTQKLHFQDLTHTHNTCKVT